MEAPKRPSLDLAELHNLLPNLSPAFRIWMASIREDRFETAVTAIIKSGQAEDEKEAIVYLNQLLEGISLKEPVYITSYDLWQPNKQRDDFREIERIIKGITEKASHKFLWRLHGTIGHTLVPGILAGVLPEKAAIRPRKTNPAQTSFFLNKTINKQLTLSDEENKEWILSSQGPESRGNRETLSRVIKKNWKTLAPRIAENQEPAVILSSHRNEIKKFYQAMERLFGDYVHKIQKREDENPYLMLLTLMSWVTLLIYRQKKRILFKEIPVMEKRQGLSGGRIDALEVRLINGKPPDARQKWQMAMMTQQKFSSVGHLLFSLRERFGEITPVIIDWKFAVGDGTFQQIISPSDIKDGPLRMHAWQIYRYLTMASLDYHLLCKERGIENHWPQDNQFITGEIVYFLPIILPVTHEIILNPEEQDIFFTNEVAIKWTPAKRRSAVRYCSKQIAGNLLALLKGETQNHNNHSYRTAKNPQLALWPKAKKETSERYSAKYMIEKRRMFIDEYQIIEVVGKYSERGEPKYELHLDRLLAAVKERKVSLGFFSLPRGGFVSCIMPDHKNERTPSFHISIDQGLFKCFGCGIGGVIAPTSIPADLALPIQSPQWARRSFDKTIKAVMPDEKHIRIMTLAQEFLQKAFRQSPAETYLIKERRLDPELAFRLGAGFGNNALIEGLLDAGFTLADLVFYGFTTFNGYPHSVLENRITFPLFGINGEINNFYGRTIKPNVDRAFFHRKLSVANTGIPHGAFNLKVLESDISEVIAVEGVMDALTLIEMGFPDTIAIIGTDNKIILETIARSGKKIAIALDNDDGGKRRTYGYCDAKNRRIPGLIETLQIKGRSPTDIRDFTAEFAVSHPDMTDGMDWNDWWKKQKDKF